MPKSKLISQETLILIILLTALLVLTSPCIVHVAATNGTKLAIEPPTTMIKRGEWFVIKITLTNVTDLYAWQVSIAYNNTILNCSEAWLPSGHIFDGKSFFNVTDLWPTYTLIGATLTGRPETTFNGSGVLCQLNFTSISVGNCSLYFCPPTKLEDSWGQPIDFIVEDCEVVVSPFDVSDLSINPNEVAPNETVQVSVNVTNVGGAEGTYKVKLWINDTEEATQEITLASKATQKVTFSVQRDAVGSYNVEVDGLNGTFRVLTPANIILTDLTVHPDEVFPDETVTVSVNLTNTGEIGGSHTVSLKVNGVTEDVKNVSVSDGASENVTFTVNREIEGEYVVQVDGLTSWFRVKAPPFPKTWLIISGILISAFVIGVAVLSYRRRREKRIV